MVSQKPPLVIGAFSFRSVHTKRQQTRFHGQAPGPQLGWAVPADITRASARKDLTTILLWKTL